MKLFFVLCFFIILINFSLLAKINFYSEIYASYTYSSDLLVDNGKDKFEVPYASFEVEGDIAKNISGDIKVNYSNLNNTIELEKALVKIAALNNYDMTIYIGKQYTLFGLKNTEATDILGTNTIEQDYLSGANNVSIITIFPISNLGSLGISFQDNDDTKGKLIKGYIIKLIANKITEGINYSFSYQNKFYNNGLQSGYKPQYSAGIDMDFGPLGVSYEFINIDKNIVNDNKDCKIHIIELFYKLNQKNKLCFDYLKNKNNNFNYDNYVRPNLKTQMRVGVETKFNKNITLLSEYGQDKILNLPSIDWYKFLLKFSF